MRGRANKPARVPAGGGHPNQLSRPSQTSEPSNAGGHPETQVTGGVCSRRFEAVVEVILRGPALALATNGYLDEAERITRVMLGETRPTRGDSPACWGSNLTASSSRQATSQSRRRRRPGTDSKGPRTHDRSLDSAGDFVRGVLGHFGLATFRQGHYWLFWIGFIFPILWIIDGFIAPTERAAARAAGAA